MTDWLAELGNRVLAPDPSFGTCSGTSSGAKTQNAPTNESDPQDTQEAQIASFGTFGTSPYRGKGPETHFLSSSIPSVINMEVPYTPDSVCILLGNQVPEVPKLPNDEEITKDFRQCAVCSSQIPRNRPVSTVCSPDCALNQPDLDPIPGWREVPISLEQLLDRA